MKWDNKEIPFQRILEKEGSRTKFAGKNPMQMIVNSWEELIKAADGSDEKLQLPLVLYLSSARLWNENRVEEMSKTPNRTDAYRRCLDRREAARQVLTTLNFCQVWLWRRMGEGLLILMRLLWAH